MDKISSVKSFNCFVAYIQLISQILIIFTFKPMVFLAKNKYLTK